MVKTGLLDSVNEKIVDLVDLGNTKNKSFYLSPYGLYSKAKKDTKLITFSILGDEGNKTSLPIQEHVELLDGEVVLVADGITISLLDSNISITNGVDDLISLINELAIKVSELAELTAENSDLIASLGNSVAITGSPLAPAIAVQALQNKTAIETLKSEIDEIQEKIENFIK